MAVGLSFRGTSSAKQSSSDFLSLKPRLLKLNLSVSIRRRDSHCRRRWWTRHSHDDSSQVLLYRNGNKTGTRNGSASVGLRVSTICTTTKAKTGDSTKTGGDSESDPPFNAAAATSIPTPPPTRIPIPIPSPWNSSASAFSSSSAFGQPVSVTMSMTGAGMVPAAEKVYANVSSVGTEIERAALGAIYGNLVGDAAGAVLEFCTDIVSLMKRRPDIWAARVDSAMRMPGRDCQWKYYPPYRSALSYRFLREPGSGLPGESELDIDLLAVASFVWIRIQLLLPRFLQNSVEGNVSRLGPGQITDDGELTLSLLHAVHHAATVAPTDCQLRQQSDEGSDAISQLSRSDQFLLECIAVYYKKWFRTAPFDIGHTTLTAFSAEPPRTRNRTSTSTNSRTDQQPSSANPNVDVNARVARAMTALSAEYNTRSQANGALMRCAPLALALGPDPAICRVRALTAAEASLSHPSHVCQFAEFYYILALNHLIFHPYDAEGALGLVDQHAHQRLKVRAAERPGPDPVQDWNERNVLDWLLWESAVDLPAPAGTREGAVTSGSGAGLVSEEWDCLRMAGWLRWAFVLSFYHLRRGSSYEAAIRDTLLRGGDTDTNAAIVGTLIGARWGIQGIPSYMLLPVQTAEKPRIRRPEWLIPYRGNVEKLVRRVLRGHQS